MTAPAIVDHMPAGTAVTFLITDEVRRVVAGQDGTVVESFSPMVGRNVELADGRVVNVRTLDLESFPDDTPAPAGCTFPGCYDDEDVVLGSGMCAGHSNDPFEIESWNERL